MTRVAAVVPTRDRPHSLARCLDALERQRGVPDLEVVVVDDGSQDAAAVAAAVASSPRARLLRFPESRGPAAARNEGAREANAELVLFTDDDCEPAPDWAARLAEAIDGGAEVVAGTTVNGRPNSPLASASEAIRAYVQDRTAFAASNNLGLPARVVRDIEFDETYRYGEDRDWCARVIAAGYALASEPRAVVVHRQNDLRMSSFLRQQFGYGRGAYRYRLRHASVASFEPPGFYAGLLGRGFAQGVLPGVLVGVAQAATAAGFFAEALRREQRRSA